MEETFERTQKRDKNKALNAVLYNMLLHRRIIQYVITSRRGTSSSTIFSTTTTTSSTTLRIILFFDFNGERVPAVVIQPSEVPDGGGAFRLGVVRSVDGFDENFDLVPGFEF